MISVSLHFSFKKWIFPRHIILSNEFLFSIFYHFEIIVWFSCIEHPVRSMDVVKVTLVIGLGATLSHIQSVRLCYWKLVGVDLRSTCLNHADGDYVFRLEYPVRDSNGFVRGVLSTYNIFGNERTHLSGENVDNDVVGTIKLQRD